MLEFLKGILNEEQMAKVTEKLGDKTLNVNDGSFIPRDRLNAKTEELKELQDRLAERDKQLKEIGVKVTDNDELSKRILELQATNDKITTEYETKIATQAFDTKLEKEMAKYSPKNVKAVKALLDMENIKLDGDNLIGFKDQMEAIKASDGYLLGQEVVKGNAPPNTPNPQNNLSNRAGLIVKYNEAQKNGNVQAMATIQGEIRKLKE